MPIEFNGTPSGSRGRVPSPSVSVDVTGWSAAPIDLPPTRQEFAIGDVHGHAGHLAALLAAMDAESGADSHLTLLGDLIDRGPHSLPALRLAADRTNTPRIAERSVLLGNHEMLMLMALAADRPDAADIAELWLSNGGWTTLGEAGLSGHRLARRQEDSVTRFRAAVGSDTYAMVEDRATLFRMSGNLLFVHAGVDPAATLADALGKPRLDASDSAHPAWIRERFLHHELPFEGNRIVVHGHTPEIRVQESKGRDPIPGQHRLDGWRLGLDGGSYGTGIVAGAELRAGRYRVFTARRTG